MKRILDHVPVAVETSPTSAIRARCRFTCRGGFQTRPMHGAPTSKGRVSMRESGRRLPSFVTRGRLQREAVESGSMEGGTLQRRHHVVRPSSGPVVW